MYPISQLLFSVNKRIYSFRPTTTNAKVMTSVEGLVYIVDKQMFVDEGIQDVKRAESLLLSIIANIDDSGPYGDGDKVFQDIVSTMDRNTTVWIKEGCRNFARKSVNE